MFLVLVFFRLILVFFSLNEPTAVFYFSKNEETFYSKTSRKTQRNKKRTEAQPIHCTVNAGLYQSSHTTAHTSTGFQKQQRAAYPQQCTRAAAQQQSNGKFLREWQPQPRCFCVNCSWLCVQCELCVVVFAVPSRYPTTTDHVLT